MAVWYTLSAESGKREAAFRATLKEYSDGLKPGVTRKDVRNFVRERDIEPHLSCYAGRCADTVYLGQGLGGSFPCLQEDVYAAFEYSARSFPGGSEVLKSVDFRRESDCF